MGDISRIKIPENRRRTSRVWRTQLLQKFRTQSQESSKRDHVITEEMISHRSGVDPSNLLNDITGHSRTAPRYASSIRPTRRRRQRSHQGNSRVQLTQPCRSRRLDTHTRFRDHVSADSKRYRYSNANTDDSTRKASSRIARTPPK